MPPKPPKRIPTGSVFQKKYKNRRGEECKAKCWTVKYYVNGKPIEFSTKTEDYEEALTILRERMAKAARIRQHSLDPSFVKIDQLLDLLIEDYEFKRRGSLVDTKARVEKNLRPFFGAKKVVDTTTSLLKKYISSRRGAEAATINKEMALLRRAFRLGFQHDPPLAEKVPHFPMLEVDNARQGIITDNQYRALYNALMDRPYARVALVIAYHTGARKGEIRKIRLESVDLKNKRIELTRKTTKNKTARYLPIYGDMRAEIEMAMSTARQEKSPFLIQKDGKPVFDFEKAWKTACKTANVPQALFHDLRRTAITNMIEAGYSEKDAMEMSGHKTRHIFERYHIVRPQRQQELAQKLENHLNQKRGADNGADNQRVN